MGLLVRRLWARLVNVIHPQRSESELTREIAAHLATLEDEFRRRGLSDEDARVAARRAFGGVEQAKELHRRERSIGWLDDVRRDVRFGIRTIARYPGFTLVTVLTLALGVGANTAVFQLVDALALRPLPVPRADELVEVRIAGGNGGFGVNPGTYSELTRPLWHELQRHAEPFSGLFAWATRDVRVGERSQLHPAAAIAVSGDFFRVLGVPAWRGRLLDAADAAAACPAAVAVVSHAYWQREMGGRAIDATTRLRINLELVDVVGVTPPEFLGVAVGDGFDIALPLCQPRVTRADVFDIGVMGRLRPGWTVTRASTYLRTISAGLFAAVTPTGYSAESTERFTQFRLAAYSAARGVSALRASFDGSLRLLFAITGIILLIACANLASLTLARGDARRREMAVRTAMGASRFALIRQMLVESSLVAAMGTILAVFVARTLRQALLASIATSERVPVLALPYDWRMLLFATSLAVGTCFLIGIVPALRASRSSYADFKSGERSTTSPRERLAFQRGLVVAQVAMSLVMLVAALLFVRSFQSLVTIDTGIRTRGVTIGMFGFPPALPAARIDEFRRELLAHVQAAPGIEHAGTTTKVPLIGGGWGHGVEVGSVRGGARFTWASEGYFAALGIPILKGRGISLRDTRTSPRVCVVNEAFVRQFIGSAEPLGRTLRTDPEPGYPATVYEIVGVVPDTAYNDPRAAAESMVFAPDAQHPSPAANAQMVIASSLPADVTVERIRQHVARRYPNVVSEYADLEARVMDRLARERLLAIVAGLLGVLAVLLTVVGFYGLLSYAVAQRTPELGLRLALGARGSQLLGRVMLEAGQLLTVGLVVGIAVTLAVAGVASSLLFGVAPRDPTTLALACGLLALIAAVACYLPARRAARVDPLVALRAD
jgi:predicted permease